MVFRVPPLLALVAYAAAQGTPIINTPAGVTQCRVTQITWSGGVPPVSVSVVPSGQQGAAALADFPGQTGSSLNWRANIPAGTTITFLLSDSAGVLSQSAPVTVLDSGDASCLGTQTSTTASGTSTPATSDNTSATSRATATLSASSTRAATATSASPSTSAPANNAAVPNARVSLAGLLGLAGAVVVV